MTPQKQHFRHRPEEGIYGDCYRTAIAMLLDLPADQLPHDHRVLADNEQMSIMRAWLAERGLGLICMPFNADPKDVVTLMSSLNPGLPYVLGGFSRTGVNHMVAVLDGEIFDPSLTDAGIIGRQDDGYTWVEFIVPLSPLRSGPPRPVSVGGGSVVHSNA